MTTSGIRPLPLSSCETLSKLINISVPVFSLLSKYPFYGMVMRIKLANQTHETGMYETLLPGTNI